MAVYCQFGKFSTTPKFANLALVQFAKLAQRIEMVAELSLRRKRRPIHFAREWRRFRNLTLEQAGALIEKSAGNLSRIERGERRLDDEWVELLSTAYRCRPHDLYRAPPNHPSESAEDIASRLPADKEMSARRILRALAESDEGTGNKSPRSNRVDGPPQKQRGAA